MINPQWLELPISRTNFHGLKEVRAIELRLYCEQWYEEEMQKKKKKKKTTKGSIKDCLPF